MSELDLLVLGSGVAGLSAAVRATESDMRVGVLTKGELDQGTTRWAQGGVAAALSGDPEETDLHLSDTLSAGAGLCDIEAVRVLVDEGPGRIEDLITLGARFDRDADGQLQLAREGGHSVARVVHAGGAATGLEIERALVDAVQERVERIEEQCFAVDLIVEDGRCRGVTAVGDDGELFEVRSARTLMATGGAGQMFSVTTNPRVATGDGTAMAIRAGVAVADLEFFQFHPTALAHPSMPRPLLSEALRGHGAMLRDSFGERFVDELLPRDIVSRAVTRTMIEQNLSHVWLDATILHHFDVRFPTILADLEAVGLHPATDYLPVAPAAHHQCGGVVCDLDGSTSLPGLWAAGEVSCTGVHGANRLASNSLLEGMVFGSRVVESIIAGSMGPKPTGAMRSAFLEPSDELVIGGVPLEMPSLSARVAGPDLGADQVEQKRSELQHVLTIGAGVLRTQRSLSDALEIVDRIWSELPLDSVDVATCEVANLATVAAGMLAAAMARTESRGAHAREDFPEADDSGRVRFVLGTTPSAAPASEISVDAESGAAEPQGDG